MYIIPVSYFGWFKQAIRSEHHTMSHRPFIVMGALDCIASTLQIFAAVYLPGHLLVLLPQVSIPMSLILSTGLLGEKYKWIQYIGAMMVLFGVLLAVEPVMTHRHIPTFFCESNYDVDNCYFCHAEITETSCLSHRMDSFNTSLFSNSRELVIGIDGDSTAHMHVRHLCRWVTYNESTTSRLDFELVMIWSLVLLFSRIPLTLSTVSEFRC
jgi:hypothetical protein